MWEAEGGSDAEKLRTKALDRLGGVRGIAASHVETSLRILTRSDQQTASKILHYLVTPSGGKIAYSVADLAHYAESTPERMRELLRQMSQNVCSAAPGRIDQKIPIVRDLSSFMTCWQSPP